MIGGTPIGSAAIGSYSGEGLLPALEYAITASTTPPSLVMQINIAYDITATTTPPSVVMTATLQQYMNITASTTPPSVAMTMVSGRVYAITATTQKPSVSMALSNEALYRITASTSPPTVLMTLVQASDYSITASTKAPSVLMTISGPAVVIAAGETTAWCVNMTTGAHSRYTDYPDASEVSDIPAYFLTGVTDFGDDHEKYIHDIYIHCRLPDNGVTIDTITDEWIERTGYEVEPCDNVQGLTRRRRKLARGVKGQNWQFRLSNLDSGGFTIKQLDVIVGKSQRRI